MKMRPEAEQRLRAGFQRRADEVRDRYAAQLAHARQLAARYECGEVVGVFSRQADIRRKTVITGLLPLVALPFLIIAAGAGVPGALPAFGFFLFFFIVWYALTLWRGMRRRVWCFAFSGGFVLLDDPAGDAIPVRWDQVTAVGPVWTQAHDPVAEEPRTVLGGYRLRTADGRAHDISSSFKNVEDPYHEMGQLFRGLAPTTVGTTMPTFPSIGQVIAAYRPG
jgi:hypothetical protein